MFLTIPIQKVTSTILVLGIYFFIMMTNLNEPTHAWTTTTSSTSTSTSSSSSSTNRIRRETINWIVRPARSDDAESIRSLFRTCYGQLLQRDYDADILSKALPLLCSVREELLDCGTWYVVEHPTEFIQSTTTTTTMNPTGTTIIDQEPKEEEEEKEKEGNEKMKVSSTKNEETNNERRRKIVGCGGWTPKSPMGDDIPHLRHFATDPDYTRMGIAKLIWQTSWKAACDYHHNSRDPSTIRSSADEVGTTDRQNEQEQEENRKGDGSGGTTVATLLPSSSSASPLTMEVFSTLTAEPFYAALGFQKIKDMTIPLQKDCIFPCILMRRRPPSSSSG